jgi:hypothetical protein
MNYAASVRGVAAGQVVVVGSQRLGGSWRPSEVVAVGSRPWLVAAGRLGEVSWWALQWLGGWLVAVGDSRRGGLCSGWASGAMRGVMLVALGSFAWWYWFDLSFGVDSGDQGGGELRCIGRNLTSALSVPTMA